MKLKEMMMTMMMMMIFIMIRMMIIMINDESNDDDDSNDGCYVLRRILLIHSININLNELNILLSDRQCIDNVEYAQNKTHD